MEYEQARRVSRAIFGHRYRLELLAELAQAGEQGLCLSDMAIGHGTKASVFYPPLRELEHIGLVARRPDTGPGRRVYYAATRHEAWPLLRQLIESVHKPASG